jgi:cell division protein FtsL
MTTVAAPTRARRRGPAPRAQVRPARAKPAARVAPKERVRVGRVGTLLVLFTVFALVSAVVFHVVLAQHQLELDQLNSQIAKEQRTYEQRRLVASMLASPQRIIQEAERLGLVQPAEPAQYLYVDHAPMPKSVDSSTSDTIADWAKTKPSLGPRQP